MNNPIRVILVDPFACQIKTIQVNGDDLQSYCAALSHDSMPVHHVEACFPNFLAGRDALFVDEEGSWKPCDCFFTIRGFEQWLAGKGMIIGIDHSGNSVDCVSMLQTIAPAIVFYQHVGRNLVMTSVLRSSVASDRPGRRSRLFPGGRRQAGRS